MEVGVIFLIYRQSLRVFWYRPRRIAPWGLRLCIKHINFTFMLYITYMYTKVRMSTNVELADQSHVRCSTVLQCSKLRGGLSNHSWLQSLAHDWLIVTLFFICHVHGLDHQETTLGLQKWVSVCLRKPKLTLDAVVARKCKHSTVSYTSITLP